jgi:VWFA-related protein
MRIRFSPIPVLLFGVLASVFAQDAVRLPKPLQHEVSVTLKLIQAHVTDKAGRPVSGLKKEDFVLTDAGRRQTITEFEEHALTLATPRKEMRVAETPLPDAPRLLGRKFFLFFDFAYNSAWGIQKARDVALDFIDNRLFPTDQVALVTYAGLRRLRIPLYLTIDHARARSLVSRIGMEEAAEGVDETEDVYKRDVAGGGFRDAHDGKSLKDISEAPPSKTDLSLDERRQAEKCLDSLLALAQALRYEQGQKYLFFLSSGIPYRTLYRMDQISIAGERTPDQFAELRRKSEELLAEMATSNVTIYSINTSPLSPASELDRSGTLEKLAQATGGRFWGNVQNAEAFIDQVQEATASYYVLGYSVNETWDGKYHRIKVEVAKPGLEVRTQAGYFAPKPFADYSEIEKRIHLVDVALAENPLSQRPVRFALAAQACDALAGNNLSLAASVKLADLSDVAEGRVEILRLAFNAGDEIVDERRTEEDLRGLKGRTVHVLSLLGAPRPGTYRCRIVIRNLGTGRSAVAGATAAVPSIEDGKLAIFPPLFLKPERGAVYLKEAPAPPGTGKAGPPAGAGLSFDRGEYAPLTLRTLTAGGEITAAVRVAGKGAADARISVSFYDKLTREAISAPLQILERHPSAGAQDVLVRFVVPELEPDVYTFTITAEGGEGVEPASVSLDMTLDRGERKVGDAS